MENDIGKNIIPYLFTKDSNDKKGKIGSNQFRDIASICRQAESYAELELMIKYNIAKAEDKSSWKMKCYNKKTFGENILEAMKKVKAIDKEHVLENLELFFGYYYWQARIWAKDSDEGNNDNKKQSRSNSK